MKIWYQSLSSYRYEPVFDDYGKALEAQCKAAVRPDTEVFVTGTKVMVRDIDKYKSLMYFHKAQVMNNMLKAEKEGFDAFVIGCTYDGGMEEGREMLSIPVVGITHANYHMASFLGGLFATVTSSNYFAEIYRQLAEKYGLAGKYLPGPYAFEASEEELAIAIKKPQAMLEKFKKVAGKAVADGASVIIPNPGFLASLVFRTGLKKIGDAQVLDTAGVAVKFAEVLVDLKKIGIEVSRTLQVYGAPSKKLLRESLKKYTPVFKIQY